MCVCVCTCMHTCKETEIGWLVDYKDLAHVIMGTDRSQDLQLAGRRPRVADGISYSLKVGRLSDARKPVFEFESKRKKKVKSHLEGSQGEGDRSY